MAELKICSLLGARGTPGDGLSGHPCQLAYGPCCHWGLQSQPVSSSFQDPVSQVLGGYGLPLLQQTPQREPTIPPMMPPSPKEDETMPQLVSIPLCPTVATAGPLGGSMLPAGFPRGPPVPCHIAGLKLPAEAFRWVNLKGSGKAYMFRECHKMSSNQVTMVSHYIKEHLRIHLVCPKCGMSNSNPSNFHHHGRKVHNLLSH